MTFEHYIITRFNLPVFAKKINKSVTASACSEEYLNNRFPIFENYCLPSIKNQTCQNFKWLVLFDINTPQRFKDWVDRIHHGYPNFIPCYFDIEKYRHLDTEYNALYEHNRVALHDSDDGHINLEEEIVHHVMTPSFIRDEIRKLSTSTPDFYITTRIDNDDAFHKDMVATIQQFFIKDPRAILYDFPFLYKIILNEGIVYKFSLVNGHFSSLIEPGCATPHFVTYWNHLHVERFVETRHIYTKPLGVELVHGMNVCNDFTDSSISGILYAILHFSKKDFGYKDVKTSFLRNMHIVAYFIKETILGRR